MSIIQNRFSVRMTIARLLLASFGVAVATASCTVPDEGPEPFPGSGGSGGGPFNPGGAFGCGEMDSPFFGSGGASFTGGPAVFSPSGNLPPQLGPTITPAVAPPAISGGTLRLLRDGRSAVASDPDRDQIYVVDLGTAKVVKTIVLMAGDEPGRLVEDAAGRVHVSLRRGGAVVTLAPTTWAVAERRQVCASPRGLAYDAKLDRVHVACTDGQLVSLPAAGGVAVRTVRLDRDLRDVVVDGDSLLVSRFRSAQVLTVNAGGTVAQRLTPGPFQSFEAHFGQRFTASVAWRMVEMPGGGAAMVHQRGLDDMVESQPGGYGGFNPCDAIVHTSVTVMKNGTTSGITPAIPALVLPTDVAVSADGKRIALVATGNATNGQPGQAPSMTRVFVTDMASVTDSSVGCRGDGVHGPCVSSGFFGGMGGFGFTDNGFGATGGSNTGSGGAPGGSSGGVSGGMGSGDGAAGSGAGGRGGTGASVMSPVVAIPPPPQESCKMGTAPRDMPEIVGEPVAVAFDAAGGVVVQTREPAALFLPSGAKVVLSTDSRMDTGHTVFHSNAGGGVACASCHPEGTDDGRVWNFSCEGQRRTQALDIGIAGTEPFHWSGDMKSFSQLMNNVFVGRMSGPKLAGEQLDATFTWIDRQPRARSAVGMANDPAVQRGRALFNDSVTGGACATCHAGAKFTNNSSADVGTGGLFQVPSLIGIGSRAPFMHNGCAKTLADRFSVACGGGDKHGPLSRLGTGQIADLVAFMETL